MSETTPAPQNAPGTAPAAPLVVNIQYIKDLSFEVPGAPAIFTTLRAAPRVDLNLDVQARRVTDGQDVFEVILALRADASDPNAPTNGAEAASRVFLAELADAGVFTLTGSP
jgi:preprotein translocase subunit SecB